MIVLWNCQCPREKEMLTSQKMTHLKEELIYKTSKIHQDLMSIAVEMKIKDFIIESRSNALKITISKQCTVKL
jgi:hypothetical protein